MAGPVILTCGEPAGVGPELAVKARQALGASLPFCWMGDPRHLPVGTALTEIAHPSEAATVPPDRLPVLRHDFPHPTTPGTPDPANAQGVLDVIARAVALVKIGRAHV